MEKEKRLDMTQGQPTSLILRFAIPVIMGLLFNSAYSLVGGVVVGQFVGPEAFSAIGATTALANVFFSVTIGTSFGAGVVVSHHVGAKDEEGIVKAITNGFYVNMFMATLCGILTLLFARPLLLMLNTPESLIGDATTYMHIWVGAMVIVALYYVPFDTLRALGDAKTPLIFMVFCSFLTIALDFVMVVLFGLGVAGAALAIILAELIAAICCYVYMYQKIPYIKMALKHLKPDKVIMMRVLKTSIPLAFQTSLMYLSIMGLQSVVNGFGEVVIGAFAAVTQIELLVQLFFNGMGQAIVTYTGQNIGARKVGRIPQGLHSSLKICLGFSILIFVLFQLFSGNIMSIFVDDASMISIASVGIRISGSFAIFYGVTASCRFLLSGAGDTGFVMVLGITEIAARIGFAHLLTGISSIGVWGIFLTTGLTWGMTALVGFIRYKKGAWKTKALNIT